jgi:anti-sigma B factor antagonist
LITLDIERIDDVPVARPRGDIDAANARRTRVELIECIEQAAADDLVLDLTATRYIDSAGIDMLLRLSELLRQRRARLRLVIAPASPLARLAEIVGLSRAMPVHASVEEALSAPPGGEH